MIDSISCLPSCDSFILTNASLLERTKSANVLTKTATWSLLCSDSPKANEIRGSLFSLSNTCHLPALELNDVGDEGVPVADSPAWVVTQIFTWIALEGRSSFWVAKRLNDLEIKAPAGGIGKL